MKIMVNQIEQRANSIFALKNCGIFSGPPYKGQHFYGPPPLLHQASLTIFCEQSLKLILNVAGNNSQPKQVVPRFTKPCL